MAPSSANIWATATSRPATPGACSSSTPPTSIPISTIIAPAPKPISPSTRRAAGAASTVAIRLRWKLCWPCPTRRSTCAPDSLPPSYNASQKLAAAPKLPSACSRPNANSSRRCAERRQGRGNDGTGKSPKTKSGIRQFLGKRKTQRRAFHIPTAPTTAVRLVQNLNLKGASSTTVPALPQAHSSIGKDYDKDEATTLERGRHREPECLPGLS